MIGKLCILLCTMVTMVAKERHVPVRTQNRTQEACQAYVTLAKTTAYRYEPVTFSCYVSGPCETMRQPQLNWHDTEASIYIYPSPHVYEQGNQRVWCWSGVWYLSVLRS